MVIICVLGGYVGGFYGYSQAKPPRCSTPAPSLCRCIYSDKGWEVLVCFVKPPRCSTKEKNVSNSI